MTTFGRSVEWGSSHTDPHVFHHFILLLFVRATATFVSLLEWESSNTDPHVFHHFILLLFPNANQHKITEKRIAYFRFSGSYAPGFVPRPMLEQTWRVLKDKSIFSYKKLSFSRNVNSCFAHMIQIRCKEHQFSLLQNDRFFI